MKIAVVAPTFLPSSRANTIQVMKMTQALMEIGHTVRLAVPSPHTDGISHRWDKLAHHYGLQHEFDIQWLVSSPTWRGYDFGWRAMRWARLWEAQYVYTRHPQTAAFCSLTAIPTILEVHDLPSGWMADNLFRTFLGGKGARRLAVITYALASDLAARYPALSSQIPPQPQYVVAKNPLKYPAGFVLIAPDGVDLVRYAGLPDPQKARSAMAHMADFRRVKLQAERFTAGYTGHLYAGRGTDLLLDLAQRLPQIGFLIVGGEPARVEDLRREAKKRRLKNMHITGFIPNADLPLVQAACDVLLMPYQERVEASSGGDISRYLSPMKAFEYLACGRPIIASNLPVFREIFNDQNCLLVTHANVEEWVDALLRLQNDPDLRQQYAQRARRDVQQYEWKARAARILEGLPETDD
jgi:glycosyltransferase involved in cell wall biosynthesis